MHGNRRSHSCEPSSRRSCAMTLREGGSGRQPGFRVKPGMTI